MRPQQHRHHLFRPCLFSESKVDAPWVFGIILGGHVLLYMWWCISEPFGNLLLASDDPAPEPPPVSPGRPPLAMRHNSMPHAEPWFHGRISRQKVTEFCYTACSSKRSTKYRHFVRIQRNSYETTYCTVCTTFRCNFNWTSAVRSVVARHPVCHVNELCRSGRSFPTYTQLNKPEQRNAIKHKLTLIWSYSYDPRSGIYVAPLADTRNGEGLLSEFGAVNGEDEGVAGGRT